jgi:hypothetical protein
MAIGAILFSKIEPAINLLDGSVETYDGNGYPTPEEIESEVPLAFIQAHPLVNIYAPKSVYFWYRLVPDGEDLGLDEYHNSEVGVPPKWFVEQDTLDVETALGVGRQSAEYKGRHFQEGWIIWALEHGICQGQPFLVQIDEERWYRSGGEYDEWDSEQDAVVVYKIPLRPKRILKSWEKTLKETLAHRERVVKAQARLKRLQLEDTKALLVKTERYHVGEFYYDDMGSNQNGKGLSVTLYSEHAAIWGRSKQPRNPAYIVSGKSDTGDFREAFMEMFHKAIEKGYDPLAIMPLAGGQVGFSRWERISLGIT